MTIALLLALLLILLIIAIRFLNRFLDSAKGTGWFGERIVAFLLRRLDQNQYRRLHNIYLPLPDGTTTQIDHIVVSAYGVFVIETKTYKGWIFGDANSKVWTQAIVRKGFRKPLKHTFQNPIRQNYAHLCAIERCTGIPKDVMRPVIALSGEATFKTERPEGVCSFGQVVGYIRSFTTPLIEIGQVNEIVDAFREWQATLTHRQRAKHVENLKRRHEGILRSDPVPQCPYCGSSMVLRTSKSGGKSFYGCSTYPKCRGIVRIRE